MAGSIANESLPLTPTERGELGRVPDLSVRSLAYTGLGESVLKADRQDAWMSLLIES